MRKCSSGAVIAIALLAIGLGTAGCPQPTDNSGQDIPGPAGPQGPQGVQGEQGEQGLVGPQGPQGPAGPQGAQGATGATGAQGTQGAQGAAGVNGTDGTDGAQGPQGIQGDAGAQGPQGPAGPQGAQGAQGADGLDLTGVIGRGVVRQDGAKESGDEIISSQQLETGIYRVNMSLVQATQLPPSKDDFAVLITLVANTSEPNGEGEVGLLLPYYLIDSMNPQTMELSIRVFVVRLDLPTASAVPNNSRFSIVVLEP